MLLNGLCLRVQTRTISFQITISTYRYLNQHPYLHPDVHVFHLRNNIKMYLNSQSIYQFDAQTHLQ